MGGGVVNDRLSPEREVEIAAAVAELDADRALSFGTWTASPVTEKTMLPPEEAFAVEDVARMGGATLRGSVGVFGDERHAAFTALARTAVSELLAELAAVRAERDEAQERLSSVLDLCDREQRNAMRWENPIPVPEWVAPVQRAALGDDQRTEAAS